VRHKQSVSVANRKNKIDFTCSAQLITTRSMKAATVAPSNDECAICLMSETAVLTQNFICGCVVKAHSTCLSQWFSKPESKCVYCRKPTAIRPTTVIRPSTAIGSPLTSRRINPRPERPGSANILTARRLTPPPLIPVPRRPAPPRSAPPTSVPLVPAPRRLAPATSAPSRPAPPISAPRTYPSSGSTKSNSSTYTTTQFMVLVGIKIVLITIATLLIVLL
jgi:hypothetical protein